jgi:hypothetical protein
MMKSFKITIAILLATLAATACNDYPVDEDGLLITERDECYVSSFSLSGVDRRSVTVAVPAIIEEFAEDEEIVDEDKLRPRIEAEVYFGTDLRNLYPVFNLVTDAKLEPKITGLTDFSDLTNPRQYTVISGNRKVRKTYTVYITVQQPR